jgi:GPI inositol-deacylase
MRRRSSGSSAEEEGEGTPPDAGGSVSVEASAAAGRSNEYLTERPSTTLEPPTSHLPVPQTSSHEIDPRKGVEKRLSPARNRVSNRENWKPTAARHGQLEKTRSAEPAVITVTSREVAAAGKMSDSRQNMRRPRLRSPWSCSPLTLVTTLVATLFLSTILHSFVTRQLDTKGCRMSYMRPSFAKLSDFDTEHTRFASKYSTYLYREGLIDEDTKVQ